MKRLQTLYLIVVLLAMPAGCKRTTGDRVSSLEQGKRHVEKREYSQAAEQFRMALFENPMDVEASVLLTEVLLRMGNPTEAIEVCGRALALRRDSQQLAGYLGRAYVEAARAAGSADPKRRKAHLDSAETLAVDLVGKKDPVGYYVRGLIYLMEPNEPQAVIYLKRSLELDPELGEAHMELASLYADMAARRPDDAEDLRKLAVQHYMEAIVYRPHRELAARMGMARIAMQKGDIGEAESHAQAALAKRPKDLMALKLLGECDLHAGRPDDALAVARQMREADSSAYTTDLEGKAYFHKEEYAKAVTKLTAAANRDPEDLQVQLLLAQALDIRGEPQQATSHFRHVLAGDRDWVKARYIFASFLVRQGELREAAGNLRVIVEEEPRTPKPRSRLTKEQRALYRDARALFVSLEGGATSRPDIELMGRPRSMEEAAGVLLRIASKSALAFPAIREAAERLESGQPKAAAQILRAALRERPGEVALYQGLAETETARGRIDQTLGLLGEAEARMPGTAQTHSSRAQALIVARRPDLALAEAKRALARAPLDANPKRQLAALYLRTGDPNAGIALCQELREERAGDLMDAANLVTAFRMAGRFASAAKLGEALVKEHAQTVAALTVLAKVYRTQGRATKAEPVLTQICTLDSNHAATGELAAVLSAEGRYARSESFVRKLFESHPDRQGDPLLHAVQAANYAGIGVEENAEAALAKLRDAADKTEDPGVADLYCRCAVNTYAVFGQRVKTDELTEKRLALNVSDTLARELPGYVKDLWSRPRLRAQTAMMQNRVLLAAEAGWMALAVRRARELMEKIPQSAETQILLGRLQRSAGDRVEAERTFFSLVSSDPSARVFAELAAIAAEQGRGLAAKGFYAKAAELDPSLEDAHLGLGILAEEDKNERAAVQYYETGVRNVPKSARMLGRLARLYGRHIKSRPKAFELAQKAHRLDPDNGIVLDALGWLCLLHKQPDQAVKHLRRATETRPYDADVWYHLGKAQAERRQTREALHSFETALLLDPDADFARDARAYVTTYR